ncbi:hypothetical protein [Brevibacillus sp. H7]|uniref:hypothetical protein n=1 Tax=Brevibacillus sp. H7 TaxID=3349138 RepID=UPI003809E371
MKESYTLATRQDDEAIRRLLANTPMEGSISVAFEREPDYFSGLAVEGDVGEVITVKKNDELIAMASRSIRTVYLNGIPQTVGYLSQLRVAAEHRDMQLLVRGHHFLKEVNRSASVPLHLATIISDNQTAIKVLTSRKFGLPVYQKHGRLHTLAIQLRRKMAEYPCDFEIRPGSEALSDEIIACLQRNGKEKQFYPYYTKAEIASPERSRDLSWEDFYVAVRDNRVIGVCAVWDQHRFKQTVVKSYSGAIRRFRWLYNLGAALFRLTPLPPVNQPFRYFYLSHIAVDDNHPHIFAALVRKVYNDFIDTDYAYFMVGLFADDPLCQAVLPYKPILYQSDLYLVYWEEAQDVIEQIDGRFPYLEIARL